MEKWWRGVIRIVQESRMQRRWQSASINNAADDVVAFVTLEPCSFQGRTPSCAQTLIDAGIKTVCVGILDPDPRYNGQGIEKMRAAGINVEVGILAHEISAELRSFLGKAP
tara:strand:- start:791 stop:1123 length:333 start_codon:yes stop_codon:yes gene_type:complete